MKKLLFWMVLIVCILALIGSCKKDENEESTTTATTPPGDTSSGGVSCKAVTSCSGTASSDNITGIAGPGWISGTYDKLIIYANSGLAVDNITGCVSQSQLLSGPTGTKSLKFQTVFTGSNSYADKVGYYSDTSCSSPILTYVFGKSDAAGGDNLSSLTVSGKPSTATQYTYKDSCYDIYPYNAAGATFLNTLFSSSMFVAGTRVTCEDNGKTYHGLVHVSDSSWDSAANDNRTLLMDDGGSTAFSTWIDPDSIIRID